MNTQTGSGPLPTAPFDRDDGLLAAAVHEGRPRFAVYRWEKTAVVIGRGGSQERELEVEAIARDGVPLLRRPGGGCSVVLDPGNLIVSLAVPLPGIGGITGAFRRISAWLIAGLGDCGIDDVRQEGVSDLVREGRKIGGSCVRRTRGLLYYSTTLLVAPRIELAERYLKHPPREPGYRAGRPHREFMGTLHPRPWQGSPEELLAALEPRLAAHQDRYLVVSAK